MSWYAMTATANTCGGRWPQCAVLYSLTNYKYAYYLNNVDILLLEILLTNSGVHVYRPNRKIALIEKLMHN